MIDAEKILPQVYPNLKSGDNKILLNTLKKLIHQDELNTFIQKNRHLRGFTFLDQLLDYFKFSYQTSHKSYSNIPSQGRLVIIANHPIGTLDGLALLKLVRSVRPDVRIVANRLLATVEPLKSLFINVEILSDNTSKKAVYKILMAALENEEAVILFPAGEVSRITPKGIQDCEWKSGFVKLAKKTGSPVLPIHIKARNSTLFYAASSIYKPFGTLLLVEETFNKQHQDIKIKVGAPIPYQSYQSLKANNKALCQRFRKHVFNLSKKNKKPIFKTEDTIAHPVNTKALKKALYHSRILGETRDSKKIFLYHYHEDCPVMQEIARLRELTFRTVEEGTGQSFDLDQFDTYYQHLVLWDEQDLEIVGAYRIGNGQEIMKSHGIRGFYSNTLFDLKPDLQDILTSSIELGRSFVQPRYWGQRSLDYLWYGIGAYLREQSDIRYLFGPVSLSNAYPDLAKEMIISFYKQQFGSTLNLAEARQPFTVSDQSRQFAETEFNTDYKSGFKLLNSELKKLGVKVPVLYKQYVELCTDGGCHFLDFNIDPDFNNCIDSLIMVEVNKIRAKKRQRYIEASLSSEKSI